MSYMNIRNILDPAASSLSTTLPRLTVSIGGVWRPAKND